ncbi:hypothetical protein PRIPAC_91258 [Pristionchus pacificus]|uniref:Zinc finger protein n=1 Tax=Pristionchus pacificus TaxID=54126 RepID=A0A2A6B930_PRIPA|nr:hypothetical protein PRIPAC_91258 [Pristionchus pacificus]|eukprot:PDM62376.1 zinc finger protein [Pristionchus pacificus]
MKALHFSRTDSALGRLLVETQSLMTSVFDNGTESPTLPLKITALRHDCVEKMAGDPNREDDERLLHYGTVFSICALLTSMIGTNEKPAQAPVAPVQEINDFPTQQILPVNGPPPSAPPEDESSTSTGVFDSAMKDAGNEMEDQKNGRHDSSEELARLNSPISISSMKYHNSVGGYFYKQATRYDSDDERSMMITDSETEDVVNIVEESDGRLLRVMRPMQVSQIDDNSTEDTRFGCNEMRSLICDQELNDMNTENVGSRMFKCRVCSTIYENRNDLRRCNAAHSRGKKIANFKCEHCGKYCCDNWVLRRHRDAQHRVVQNADSNLVPAGSSERRGKIRRNDSRPPLNCDQCGKTFRDNGLMRRHMGVHKAMNRKPNKSSEPSDDSRKVANPFKCAECGQGFKNTLELMKHRMATH